MRDYRLRERIAELKGALALVETSMKEQSNLTERLDHLRSVVDDTRKSVWAVLSAANSDDYNRFISGFRLRRAAETLRSVGEDIDAGTIDVVTPGVDTLEANLRDVLDAMPLFTAAAKPRAVFKVK